MGSAVSALAGCDHFGVHLLYTAINKATTTAYRWMFEDPNNPGQLIASPNNIVVPTPVYTWIPPAPPSPAARPPQFGDATWMKVFGTDMTRDVPLTELTSDNPIVPQTLAQVETEWQLIQPALRCCDAMRPTPTPARTIR
jgi:hypothetical protein